MITPGQPIRVLIVDDSLVAREMLAQILATDVTIEVVGMARDGLEAVDAVAELKPDLVTMDIHMPKMDGLRATAKIMAYHPTPILVVSSSVHGEGMGSAFDALGHGALEVIKKPEPRDWADLERIGKEVIRKVKVLARVRVITHIAGRRERPAAPSGTVAAPATVKRLVAVGSSTGGPTALLAILGRLPEDFPVPVVIAQHIADGFVPGLVSWLDSGSPIAVREAHDGEDAVPGAAYLAPTGRNLAMDGVTMHFVDPGRGQLYIPSADTLFESVAKTVGRGAIGVILTGMGADGAYGLKAIRDGGGMTIAQDEATCTVYGMPRAAAEIGAAQEVLAVHDIAARVAEMLAGSPA